MLYMSCQLQVSSTAHLKMSLAIEGRLLPEIFAGIGKHRCSALHQFQGDALAAEDVYGGTGIRCQTYAIKADGTFVLGNKGEGSIGSRTRKDIGNLGCRVGIIQADMLSVRLYNDAGSGTSDARSSAFRPFHIYSRKVV